MLARARERPDLALLAFAATFFIFHQAPALVGGDAGDAIDLITPLAVLASGSALLIGLGVRGSLVGLALLAGVLYIHGHGIHLAANSINNAGPSPMAADTVHFWDEVFSHYEAVIGWYGMVILACLAEARTGASHPPRLGVVALTSSLLGWAFFTGSVEGSTWPLLIAVGLGFSMAWWRSNEPPGAILASSLGAYGFALSLLAIWAIWQGGVPEFTEAGLL